MKRITVGNYYGVIYVITNTVTGEQYVGQTTRDNPKDRWNDHLRGARNDIQTNRLFCKALRKYGESIFVFKIIWYATTKVDLDAAEDRFIVELGTLVPNGYNLRRGGARGHFSESAKVALKATLALPEVIAKKSLIAKTNHAKPKVKVRHRAGVKASLASPERKAQRSVVSKLLHSRPEVKLKHKQNLEAALASPEVRAKMGVGVSEARKRPEVIANHEAYWSTPGVKEAHSLRMQAVVTPEMRLQQSKNFLGRLWITNGFICARIKPGDPLPEGWRLGRLYRRRPA